MQIEALFVQVLLLAREMKLLRLGQVALDGTKIKAQASKHKALSWAHANRIEAQLREEVQTLMALADRADAADGMDVPAEIARREERLAALAQAAIEQRAQERMSMSGSDRRSRIQCNAILHPSFPRSLPEYGSTSPVFAGIVEPPLRQGRLAIRASQVKV